jgi:prepilin-type processing-associated H-X9-DG protein
MHSWRVLLLPYLEQKHLYDQYDFNEPWDGPNNSRLAASMPALYACPSDDSTPGRGITSYVVVAGPGTAFDASKAAAFRDIRDGVANTLLVVETSGTQINWLEPRDLDLNQMTMNMNGGGTEISSNHTRGANALFADGSVHFLSDTLPPQTLQGLLTIQGGEQVSPF